MSKEFKMPVYVNIPHKDEKANTNKPDEVPNCKL